MEEHYKRKLDDAFCELRKALLNAEENIESEADREYFKNLLFDLNELTKDMY